MHCICILYVCLKAPLFLHYTIGNKTHTHTQTHTDRQTHTHTHTHTRTHTHRHVHVHTRTCSTHRHTHTDTHAHRHTRTQTQHTDYAMNNRIIITAHAMMPFPSREVPYPMHRTASVAYVSMAILYEDTFVLTGLIYFYYAAYITSCII